MEDMLQSPARAPAQAEKPTRGNGGTESGRKRGRRRSGTVSTAQFGSSVVIVSQDLAGSCSPDERSDIRGGVRVVPDVTFAHPGYATNSKLRSGNLVDRHLVRDAAQRHASRRWLQPAGL